jgi:hypothetical protein
MDPAFDKYELLHNYTYAYDSRLKVGEKAIAAMKQIDTLWQSNLTQDEFDKQLVIILLQYKGAKW